MREAVEVFNPGAVADLIVTCDHAGNAVPEELGDLGLPKSELARHIAWDIGAAGVARRIARLLNAPAVLAMVSRLVIDPNRPLGDADSIPITSDGSPIPGNQGLGAAARAARADAFFHPYHRAIEHEIERLRRAGRRPAVLSVHSFTPTLNVGAQPRPWHIGVMHSYDAALADVLVGALAREERVAVGRNQPYSGFIHGYAQKRHGLAQGLAHAQLEIRQDLLADDRGQERWSEMVAAAMASWLRHGAKEVAHG